MKQFTPIQLQLLNFLGDETCQSGHTIAQQLGVSRTAIWKQINQLTELGLPIKRNTGQGYQLDKPFIALNETAIRHYLSELNYQNEINFNLFATIDSTNRFLKDLPISRTTTICCSEAQTKGRGRFGRKWHSPFGENIYFSGRWQLTCCLSQLSGLSLIVSLAILTSLQQLDIQHGIQLKWPNDLLWQHRKLAGVLIEILAETNGCVQIIIGIGINVNTSNDKAETPWCSLREITGQFFDRNQLIATLIYTLDSHLKQFLAQGFKSFQNHWQQVDYLNGRQIEVFQANTSLSGYACGVNEQGQLCLKDEHGNYHYLSSGDTSLKKQS
ncbi:biotin-[acetylCoA carboxylase] holoenzyme synthetase and biotin operon repressor [Legionella beliardensis]|uniref:Bifunctional ligase/repressor BirA n=1 Tax=Legionella beliardensis TaxID=91822 RepID=A0A378I125_9GAMM|nr:biotin--[acetyl-CoA-carboxylase] ligase [Legionella beliardensis]STX28683.1 biotin-[acetylCoA carboxylase] holoenzyme synthetase and biotin operon repressor [Legionella beliardensis]